MIRLLQKEEWEESLLEPGPGCYCIDLRPCQTTQQMIIAIGNILRSHQSTPITEESVLEGLGDVIFDFFCEHWGEEKKVYIAGLAHASKIDSFFAIDLVSTIDFYFVSAIEAVSRTEPELSVHKEIGKTLIYAGWN